VVRWPRLGGTQGSSENGFKSQATQAWFSKQIVVNLFYIIGNLFG